MQLLQNLSSMKVYRKSINDCKERIDISYLFYSNEKINEMIENGLYSYSQFIDFICENYKTTKLDKNSLMYKPEKAFHYYNQILHTLKHKYTELLIPPVISKSALSEELKTLYYSRKMILYIITSVLKDDNSSNSNQTYTNSSLNNTIANNNNMTITTATVATTTTIATAANTATISLNSTANSNTNSPEMTNQKNLISYTTAANETTNNKHQSDLEEILFTYIQKEIEFYTKEILIDSSYKPNTLLFKQYDYMMKDIFISLQNVNLNTKINILKRTSFNVIQIIKKSSNYVIIEILKYLQLTLPFIYPSDIPPGIAYFTTLLEIGSIILYDYDIMKKRTIHVGISNTLLLLYDYIINTILILFQSEKWNCYLIESITTKFNEINKAFKNQCNSIKAFAKQSKELYSNLLLLFDISGSYDCYYYNHCNIIYNGIKGELINYNPNENDGEYVSFKTSMKTEEIKLINSIPINKVITPFLPELYGKEEIIKFIDILLFSYIKSGINGDITELLLYSKLCNMLKYQTNDPIICSKLYEFKTFDIIVNHISEFTKFDKLNSKHDLLLKYYNLYKLYIESHYKNSQNLFKPFEEKEKPVSNPITKDDKKSTNNNNNNNSKKISKYDQLIYMGFKSKIVKAALHKNRSLEDAIEWILERIESDEGDDDDDDDDGSDSDSKEDIYIGCDKDSSDTDDSDSDDDDDDDKKKKKKKKNKKKDSDNDSDGNDDDDDDGNEYDREIPELDLDNKRVYIY